MTGWELSTTLSVTPDKVALGVAYSDSRRDGGPVKKIKSFLLLASVLVSVMISGAAAAFTSMFVFGDSNSDNGRRLQIQGTKPASPPYFMGRHSNGPVAVEYVAAALGLAAPGQFVDYAVGGALSGHGNVDPHPLLANTGLLDQFTTFQSSYSTADPNALYFIYGGDNDINTCKGTNNSSCRTDEITAVVANLVTLVQGLSDHGARHFMVIGSYGGGADKNEFRSLLPAAMQSLDATLPGDIVYFTARPVLLEMIAVGNRYGFTQTSSASPCSTGTLTGGGSVCSNPERHVFWDLNGHLTAPAHQILGHAMIAAVPEPETYAMMLAGLGLLGFIARRRSKLPASRA